MESTMEGNVKWFNEVKGFGFISVPEISEDVFVHHTAIQASGFRTLTEGARVCFDVEQTSKGLKANNVYVISESGNQ
jgi:CspA family cold shock protein